MSANAPGQPPAVPASPATTASPAKSAPVEHTRKWGGKLHWQGKAITDAESILEGNLRELRSEAERIAVRAKAGVVTPHWVAQAADRVGFSGPSALADVFLAVGGLLGGVGGGFGTTLALTPVDLDTGVYIAGFSCLVVGLCTLVVGITLKMVRR